MYNITFLIPTFLLSLSSLSSVYAQHTTSDISESDLNQESMFFSEKPELINFVGKDAVVYRAIVKALVPISIRDAPPHGLLNLFVGKEINKIAPGMELEIIGKKTYPGFSGTHVWYQLSPLITNSPSEQKPDLRIRDFKNQSSKWIYGGVEDHNEFVTIRPTYSTM